MTSTDFITTATSMLAQTNASKQAASSSKDGGDKKKITST